jgi:FMN phosphatase YigB (HAD superfamily)
MSRNLAVVAAAGFDIDNTLKDADSREYDSTLLPFFSFYDVGVTPQKAIRTFEVVRSQGAALQRIGMRNPIHERGNADALSVFCIGNCVTPTVRSELGIDSKDQDEFNGLLLELAELDMSTRRGSFEKRLWAECRVRAFCEKDARVARFRGEALRIAHHPRIVNWSQRYRELEASQPVNDVLPLMRSLASRGMMPIIISEGRSAIQAEKLDRLGLTEFFEGRVLVTEAAGQVPGVQELDKEISRRLEEHISATSAPIDPELKLLWYSRCLVDGWATKSAPFFARCLHAIEADSERPQDAFQMPAYVQANTWRERPLRFAMVGDKYDKDVEPLVDLLGPGVGLKIRLRMGKYGALYPEQELRPERRPERTFTDWDSLAHFLSHELTPEMVPPITRPPDILDRSVIRADYVERGLDSPFEAVRHVAQRHVAHAAAEMLGSRH